MPTKTPKACRKRGCPHTTTDRSGYCQQHRHEGWQRHQKGMNKTQRGYGYSWTVRRAQILERDHHLCQSCLKNGRAVTATTVDHIIPKAQGGTDEASNLQALCWPCHRSKTATERFN